MFKISQKVAELECRKLQTEIVKKQSKQRQMRVQQRLMMASNKPGTSGKKGGVAKNLKRARKDDEEELKDLEELMDPEFEDKPMRKTGSVYRHMTGFVTKSEDRKARLDQRHKWIVAAVKGKPDDDDDYDDDEDDDDETEKERLECETQGLESQLKKVEWAQAAQRDKEEKEKVKSLVNTSRVVNS